MTIWQHFCEAHGASGQLGSALALELKGQLFSGHKKQRVVLGQFNITNSSH